MGTKIEWCDATWNPVTGCTKISAGCKNCFAERTTKRLQAMGTPKYAAGFGKVVCHRDTLEIPSRWKKPRRVFVNSMSDLFHEDVPVGFLLKVWDVMDMNNRHVFQVLTKRPENARDFIEFAKPADEAGWPLPNVWLGTSVENQAMADQRIPHLLETPAAVRFLSVEPLIAPVNLAEPLGPLYPWLDWVIIGCESGHNRRPCELEWVESIVDQCDAAGVPVFVKQLDLNGRVSKDPAEWPKWARLRNYPAGKEPT